MLSYESDIEPLATEWTWQDRLPRGEVVLMAGAGGVGKGLLLALIGSHISAGVPLPGESLCKAPGDVVMVTGEDNLAETVTWRLRAAKADLGRIHDMTETDDGSPFMVNEPGHIGELRASLEGLPNPQLLIVDPVAASVSKSLASVHVVRQMLLPLQRLARDTGVCVLLSHHLTKAGTIAGSKGLVDTCRIVYRVEKAPDNPTVRVIKLEKANVLPGGLGDIRYRLTGAGRTVRAEWVTRASSKQAWRRNTPPNEVRSVIERGAVSLIRR